MENKEETKFIPGSLEEAIDYLISRNDEKSLAEIKKMNENQFMGAVHFGMGMAIRNEWYLWWHAIKGREGVPEQIPGVVAELEKYNIFHGDDISGIILTSTYRKIMGLDRDLEGQVAHYIEHWKRAGYENGICKP
jgi:hypothetical protein